MKLQRAIKYRIYPTDDQRAVLDDLQLQAKRAWNCMVAASNDRHTARRIPTEFLCWSPTKGVRSGAAHAMVPTKQCSPYLTALRKRVAPTLPRHTLNYVADNIDKAWRRFFDEKRKAQALGKQSKFGPPQYKRDHTCIGLASPFFGVREKSIWWASEQRFRPFKAVIDFPPTGKPQRCTLRRDVDQWYAVVTYQLEVDKPPRSTKPGIGLDRGVVYAVADSSGKVWEGPRARLRALDKKLKRAERAASKKQKGSRRREKAYERVAKIKRKQRRVREQSLHEISKHYALHYGTIVVEDLELKNMTASAKGDEENPGRGVKQKAGLNRALLEQGLGELVRQIEYKAEVLGGEVVRVPPQYTSQTCVACGHVSAQNRRSQDKFECVACGHSDNADVNAARVIYSRHCAGSAARGGTGEARPMKREPRARGARLRAQRAGRGKGS